MWCYVVLCGVMWCYVACCAVLCGVSVGVSVSVSASVSVIVLVLVLVLGLGLVLVLVFVFVFVCVCTLQAAKLKHGFGLAVAAAAQSWHHFSSTSLPRGQCRHQFAVTLASKGAFKYFKLLQVHAPSKQMWRLLRRFGWFNITAFTIHDLLLC